MSPNPNNSSRSDKNQHGKHRNNNQSSRQGQGQPSVPMSGVPFGYIPAFLPGSASLVEQLDRRIMIVLRDGRHLVGVSSTF